MCGETGKILTNMMRLSLNTQNVLMILNPKGGDDSDILDGMIRKTHSRLIHLHALD